MKKLAILSIFLAGAIACSQTSDQNKAAFVTYLGNDTLAVEQFEKNGNNIQADVILRSPRTTLSSYELTLDDSGGVQTMTRTDYSLSEGFEGEGRQVQSVRRQGDSLFISQNYSGKDVMKYSVPYAPGVLPFIDMVHWPYELAFNRASEMQQDTVSQKLLTGSRLSTFIIADLESDSMTIRHPSRGVMGVEVDEQGAIQMLDAGQTTRKLKVHRRQSVEMNAIANNFSADDEGGNPFGQLSSAETADFAFKGADFNVEYGSPKKRGRTLFGGIVAWGERWRTGANRATHFSTSQDIVIGDLQVPAGEYTLFTIPEEDGGTLIINKQTGQNGRSYDESRDLGRVPMEISQKDDTTEAFTVRVEETDTGGVLKLIWGQTVFAVDFTME